MDNVVVVMPVVIPLKVVVFGLVWFVPSGKETKEGYEFLLLLLLCGMKKQPGNQRDCGFDLHSRTLSDIGFGKTVFQVVETAIQTDRYTMQTLYLPSKQHTIHLPGEERCGFPLLQHYSRSKNQPPLYMFVLLCCN